MSKWGPTGEIEVEIKLPPNFTPSQPMDVINPGKSTSSEDKQRGIPSPSDLDILSGWSGCVEEETSPHPETDSDDETEKEVTKTSTKADDIHSLSDPVQRKELGAPILNLKNRIKSRAETDPGVVPVSHGFIVGSYQEEGRGFRRKFNKYGL